MKADDLQMVVTAYLDVFPEEKGKFKLLQSQLVDSERMNDRRNFRGHITGAGIVLSSTRNKILLIHHRFLDMWLQPGGHWDAEDANPLAAAKREIAEETGIRRLEQITPFADKNIPIDIDTHAFKARPEKNEAAHYHHDFRYVFVAADQAFTPLEEELKDGGWVGFDDPRTEHVRPLIEKLRRFKLIV